jgi:hypothetical protein
MRKRNLVAMIQFKGKRWVGDRKARKGQRQTWILKLFLRSLVSYYSRYYSAGQSDIIWGLVF